VKQGQNLLIFSTKRTLRNQAGQAVIEYVLLLVVMVALLLAAKGLFAGANQFISSYIGDYFICLMDYGELPKLSYASAADTSNCKAQFSITKGASLTTGGSSSSGSSSSSQASNRKDNSKSGSGSGSGSGSDSKNADAAKKSGDKGSDSDGRSGVSGAGANASSPYANGTISRGRSIGLGDGATSGSDKVKLIEEEDGAGNGRGYGRDRGGSRTVRYQYRNRYKAVAGEYYDELEKKEDRKKPRKAEARKIAQATEEGLRPGPRRGTVTPPPTKDIGQIEDKSDGFAFGYILKWLLIAGMVIAILIFFGGQVLNYSNSDS